MVPTVFIVAIVTAVVSIALVWREGRRRLSKQEYYVAPITFFRREMSLAGICTIAAVIIWASYMPASVRFAAVALFPTFLYILLLLRSDAD